MYFTIFLQKWFDLYTCKEPSSKKGSKDEKKREMECLVGTVFVFPHDKLKKGSIKLNYTYSCLLMCYQNKQYIL